jgi:hypothetical protein
MRISSIPFMLYPIAWFLLALLAVALHGSYQRGKELDAVCEAIPSPEVTRVHPQNALEAEALIAQIQPETTQNDGKIT